MFDDLDNLIHTDPFIGAKSSTTLHLQEGERREVCILFADCQGFTALSERLDHEVVHTLLDKLMQLFTARIKHFGGFIDKYEGDLVMALFGAKIATEHDTERAIEAGLKMLAVLEQFNHAITQRLGFAVDIKVRIGINTGEVTTGKVGEKREGDFTVYGDSVNLASRMESNAPINRIMLPFATMQRVLNAFEFEHYGSIAVKGKAEPINAWLVKSAITERQNRWQDRWTTFVGRDSEMSRLIGQYKAVSNRFRGSSGSSNKAVVVALKGEAGMGKSRLIDEFLKALGTNSFNLHGTTPRLAQQAYGLFISLIRKQFAISLLDNQMIARQKLERGLNELLQFVHIEESRTRLQESLPLLENLLNLSLEDDRTASPVKDLRPQLQTAIRYFIEACAAKANQQDAPLVVILEDLHWADGPSLATLEFLLFTLNLEERRRGTDLKQIIFLLTYRPEFTPSRAIMSDCEFEEIELSYLTATLARSLVESIFTPVTTPTSNVTASTTWINVPVSEATLALVMERSAGNPFFIEEWASYIADHPVFASPPEEGEATSLPVPATLQALILARMDQLDPGLKLLLQKAAVLGREFFVNVVEEMDQQLEGKRDLGNNLGILEANQFLSSLPGRSFTTYMFKHILTQEVAYGTLLIANRVVLHRIAGQVLEKLFADRLEDHWRDLAEHFEKGEVWSKAAEYLLKAANEARDRYNSQAALKLYDRLLKLQSEHPGESSLSLVTMARLGKGIVLELIGEWNPAIDEYSLTVELARNTGDLQLQTKALSSRGNLYRLRGEHELSKADYELSLAIAEGLNDKSAILAAVGGLGKLILRMGQLDTALEYLHRALSMAEELGDKAGISLVVGNIGIIYYQLGDLARSLEYLQKALSISEELADKQGTLIAIGNMGVVYKELGEYERALECYQTRLSTAEELGFKVGISLAVGNMGVVHYKQRHYKLAAERLNQAVLMCRELNNKPFLADFLPIQARAALGLHQYEQAADICKEALELAKELKNTHFVFQAQILTQKISFLSANDATTRIHSIDALLALLEQTDSDEAKAEMHYELVAMLLKADSESHPTNSDRVDHHRLEAIRLYEELYAKSLKFMYKKRLEELSKFR